MQTTEIIISKANSIRFANRNGLMDSFDNLLWSEESWSTRLGGCYKQTYFVGDYVLVQLKAGLTATVVLTKYVNGVGAVVTPSDTTVYSTHIIYEYLIYLSKAEDFYLTATSELSSHISETVQVIASDNDYKLVEWSSDDANKNTFQFDYTTTLAGSNVNFVRIKAELAIYEPSGEATVYDNQNEKVKIKANYYRRLTLETERIPRQLAEILTLAMQHDYFSFNEVIYTVEEYPKINMSGGYTQLTAILTLSNSEGLDTDDIGFDIETDIMHRVQPKLQEDATGTGTFSVTEGFYAAVIIIKHVGSSPVVKIGSTVGGEEMFRSELITATAPPRVDTINYIPSFGAGWTIYWEVTGGIVDISITTIMINPQP